VIMHFSHNLTSLQQKATSKHKLKRLSKACKQPGNNSTPLI
jgi:hypothetical protein